MGRKTPENYRRIEHAFFQFGMPVFDMTAANFLSHPEWDVFSFENPPSSIDIMTVVKGLSSVSFEEDGLAISTSDIGSLINAKKASARFKDLNDLENLDR